jgi:chitodextrinase
MQRIAPKSTGEQPHEYCSTESRHIQLKSRSSLRSGLAFLLSGCSSFSSNPSSPADTVAPTAPSGLTATAASDTQINLSWAASTDNVGVTGYKVERCQGAACSNFAQIAATTATTFNDTGLAPSTSYSYRVTATAASSSQINLAWSASTNDVGVTGYKVYVARVRAARISDKSPPPPPRPSTIPV